MWFCCCYVCLSDISELTRCVVCFILLATQFLDPRPEDHSELTPLEKLSVVCGVRVRTAISLCRARTRGVWISITQLWGETFQGRYAKKKGIQSLARLWGSNAIWVPCMMPWPPWNSRMGRESLSPPSATNMQGSQVAGLVFQNTVQCDASSVQSDGMSKPFS